MQIMRRTVGVLVLGMVLLGLCVCSSDASCTPVVLVTGFEPFENYTVNPSGLIAKALNGESVENATIIGVVLPVDFNTSLELSIQVIEEYHPVLIISTGLNAKTHRVNIEKIGYNMKRYQKEDGTWSFPRRIDPAGPFLRFTSLHTNTIVHNIRKANIAARQSFFPGTYVCNSLFYQLLGYMTDHQMSTQVGFIHVPLLDSQDPLGMSLEQMITAVKIAIQTEI
jgi:pyroglutamyl-peptidase